MPLAKRRMKSFCASGKEMGVTVSFLRQRGCSNVFIAPTCRASAVDTRYCANIIPNEKALEIYIGINGRMIGRIKSFTVDNRTLAENLDSSRNANMIN